MPPWTRACFPYTTLFRSPRDHQHLARVVLLDDGGHEPLRVSLEPGGDGGVQGHASILPHAPGPPLGGRDAEGVADRKSTRLNSSHVKISYAVFCLDKKKY